MAKGNIDPAFQAAPILGESSHDPIEFTRRHNMAKYQQAKAQKDQADKNTAEGLDKLMIDLKGWEDQEGFKEIMADQDKVMNTFLSLSKKGLNITNPKTSDEVTVYKAITDAHSKIKQKVDTWTRNKETYDLAMQAIKQDAVKPPEDQVIDHEKTREEIQKSMSGIGILDRDMRLEKLLVKRPQVSDVHDYVAKNLEFITKPDIVTEPYTDPVTGNQASKTREVMSPENEKKREQDLRKLYQTAPEGVINAVKIAKSKDKTLDVMKDEDYFIAMYDPQFRQKMTDKIAGKGGGLSLNFLGQKTTMEPGRQRKEPLPYGDKTFTSPYEFASAKPLRVPLGAAGSEIFMGKTWTPLTGGGDVEATLSFYDSNTDKFIFRTTQAGAAPFVMNNMTIAVPRAVIGDQADDLPIEVNGEIKKLKDVYGAMKTVAKEIPGIGKNFWSKQVYTPKNK